MRRSRVGLPFAEIMDRTLGWCHPPAAGCTRRGSLRLLHNKVAFYYSSEVSELPKGASKYDVRIIFLFFDPLPLVTQPPYCRFTEELGRNSIDQLKFQLTFQMRFRLSFASAVGHPL